MSMDIILLFVLSIKLFWIYLIQPDIFFIKIIGAFLYTMK